MQVVYVNGCGSTQVFGVVVAFHQPITWDKTWLLMSLDDKVKGQSLKVSDFILHQSGDLLKPIRQLHLLTHSVFFQRHDNLHTTQYKGVFNLLKHKHHKLLISIPYWPDRSICWYTCTAHATPPNCSSRMQSSKNRQSSESSNRRFKCPWQRNGEIF